MITPDTLEDWFELFEGCDINSVKQKLHIRSIWAREIYEHLKQSGENKLDSIKVMDSNYGCGGWLGRYLRWLGNNFDYEYGCASTTYFLNKPKAKK